MANSSHAGLLTLGEETVVTFAAPKEEQQDGGLSKQGDLRGGIYHDVNGDYAQQCWDPFDFAALAVSVSDIQATKVKQSSLQQAN